MSCAAGQRRPFAPALRRRAGGKQARTRSVGADMPRFFLNIHNGLGLVRDEEGTDVPDVEAARRKAIEGVRSILSEEIKSGSIDLAGRIEIADGDGRVVAEILFTDAVRISLPPDRADPGPTPR